MQTLFDLSHYTPQQPRRLIRELPASEQPLNRLYQVGSRLGGAGRSTRFPLPLHNHRLITRCVNRLRPATVST